MPRRYPNYPEEFQIYNVMSTAGRASSGSGYLIPRYYLTLSLFFGQAARANPWSATGLEWQTRARRRRTTSTRRRWSCAGRTSTPWT